MGSYEIRETKERLMGVDRGGPDKTVEWVYLSKATFDQARVDMQRLVDHLRLCRLFKGYEGGPLDEPWTIHIIKQAENTLAAMEDAGR